ncbi:hypothetical protein Dda_0313 [Drechslerella dactyloides]|uniref:protein S-acyltransferase n=1 Tax=Drechslerella dactyloides TaxID=74499 RepID=A0AAD6J4Y2_DREDA|nr:hypothetical protein Dda_0313 [Drechslerella dactyloides]
MVCQPGPEPPVRRYYINLPKNLPARYIPVRVWVIRVNNREIEYSPHSKCNPDLKLAVRPPPSATTYPLLCIHVIGWRWRPIDTLDSSIDFPSLGLNIPGVPGYDPTRDRAGNLRPHPNRVILLLKNLKSPEIAMRHLYLIWRDMRTTVGNIIGSISRAVAWMKGWKAWRNKQQEEEEKFKDAFHLKVDFESFMRAGGSRTSSSISEAGDRGRTALHLASSPVGAVPPKFYGRNLTWGPYKRKEISEVCEIATTMLLLQASDEEAINVQCWNGNTPLLQSISNQNLAVSKTLLDSAKVHHDITDFRGRSALNIAVLTGNPEILEFYLQYERLRALIDKQDDLGMTPLCLALRQGHVDLALMLINAGADLGIRDVFGVGVVHANGNIWIRYLRRISSAGSDRYSGQR